MKYCFILVVMNVESFHITFNSMNIFPKTLVSLVLEDIHSTKSGELDIILMRRKDHRRVVMSTVLVPPAPGFEEVEALTVVDILRCGEVKVVTILDPRKGETL
jgi:hypothetical protein